MSEPTEDLLTATIKAHVFYGPDTCGCGELLTHPQHAAHLAEEIRKAGDSITLYRIADFGYGAKPDERWFGDVFDQAMNLRGEGYDVTVESRVLTRLYTPYRPAIDPRKAKTDA